MAVMDKNLLIKELLEQRILKDEKRLEYNKNELESALNDFHYAEANKNIIEDKVKQLTEELKFEKEVLKGIF